MSNVHRLRLTNRIFFVNVNLRPRIRRFGDCEYRLGFVRHEREFKDRLEYMHMNPVRRGLVKRPEDWRWSSYNNFALDKATVAACPIQIDYVSLPAGYRA